VRGRIFQGDVDRLREIVGPRDLAVLDQVRDLKLMSGAQIQSVHFPLAEHATADAAGRCARRVLQRLVRLGLLMRLERRIGGIRGGSAGFIYAPSPLGHRLLDGDAPRRRFREPTATFVKHTLTVTQVVVELIERQRAGQFELLQLLPEPRCWRRYNAGGAVEVVRPDLFVVLAVDEYEHHWFVEVDLGTETISRRIAKCKRYEAYYRSGVEQAEQGLFPRVVWSMPNAVLAESLRAHIRRAPSLTTELFDTTAREVLFERLAGGQT
jgi:hypothetical protein